LLFFESQGEDLLWMEIKVFSFILNRENDRHL